MCTISFNHTDFFTKDDSIILDDTHSLEQIKAAHPYKSPSPSFLFVVIYSMLFEGHSDYDHEPWN